MPPSGANESPALPHDGGGGARRFRVAVCRPLEAERREDPLLGLLAEAGVEGHAFPLLRILRPKESGPLRRGARALLSGEVDVLVLTSRRSVWALARTLREIAAEEGKDASSASGFTRPPGLEVWVVGSETGRAAAEAGLAPDRMPDVFSADGMVASLNNGDLGEVQGKRILFPRAAEGREVLTEALVGAGAQVTLVEAYRSETDPEEGARLWEAVQGRELDAVALTASSQVQVLAAAMGSGVGGGAARWPRGVAIVVIGAPTAATARALGLPVTRVADPQTLDGMALALQEVREGA